MIRVLVTGVLFLSAGLITGDTLHFKNGTVVEGTYRGEQKGKIQFEKDGKIVSYPGSEIARIKIGYGGVTLCYRLKSTPETRSCDARLRAFDEKTVEIAKGLGFTEKQTLSLHDFAELELSRQNSPVDMIPVLKPGVRLQLMLTDGRLLMARVISSGGSNLKIRDDSGAVMDVPEEKIARAVILTQKPSRRISWSTLVPGYSQYHRNERKKSNWIIWGMGLSGFGMLFEERSARRDAKIASRDLFFNVTGMSNRQRSFQEHRRNVAILGGLAGGIYAYHLIDAVSANSKAMSMASEPRLNVPYLNISYLLRVSWSDP